MRKLCTFLVALALIALCTMLLPTETRAAETIASGTCGENLSWTLDDEDTLTISGIGAMTDYESAANTPWCDYRSSIGSVIIEDGVNSIGDYTFSYCDSLTSVTISDSVASIGEHAFRNCENLTSVTIPDSVTSIGCSAFISCYGLNSITIPGSVTHIGDHAFYFCTSLTSVIYCGTEEQWEEIKIYSSNDALLDATRSYHNVVDGICTACEKYVTCGDNLTWTLDDEGTLTISGTGAMTDYEAAADRPWNDYCSSIGSVVIEDGVTSIGNWAFWLCPNLTSITIPNSVTSIGEGAFVLSVSLTEVAYCGTEEQWAEIEIGSNNDELINATRYYHRYSNWMLQEPTYTAMGAISYSCIYCGEKIVEPIPARFYGTSINMGNTLDMYFGFYTGLVDENGTVKFVREFADGTTETTETPITSFKKNNSVYDITYTGLAAKEMCDTIHVYVYDGGGNLVGQHSDSIRSYILRQLREKDYGAEFRTLCVDLLNYGAAAQETFGYNTDDLANKDLTDEELAEGTQTVAEYTNKQTVTGTTASYYGTAYFLETKISMSMAVQASYFDEGCYALVSYTDHTGTEKNNIRLEGKKNNSVYEFVLNEIVVADGRCLLTVEFYNADGTKELTVQDSMESYTARNAEDYPLAEKMLAFSDSAYKYLHRNDE